MKKGMLVALVVILLVVVVGFYFYGTGSDETESDALVDNSGSGDADSGAGSADADSGGGEIDCAVECLAESEEFAHSAWLGMLQGAGVDCVEYGQNVCSGTGDSLVTTLETSNCCCMDCALD